jgi:hypothetical protein
VEVLQKRHPAGVVKRFSLANSGFPDCQPIAYAQIIRTLSGIAGFTLPGIGLRMISGFQRAGSLSRSPRQAESRG